MVVRLALGVALLGAGVLSAPAHAQAPAPSPAPTAPASGAPRTPSVVGEVTLIDAGTASLTVRTDAGRAVTVSTDASTVWLKARPGARDLAGALPMTLTEVALGDRVLARGVLRDEGAMTARQVVLMSHADIAQKQDRERAEWRRRGLVGVVTAIDPAKQEVTVRVGSFAGAPGVVIPVGDAKLTFRRYAPDSVKFTDARPSSIAELKVGDQLRALGERTPDGGRFVPEQIVSGSFRNVSGVVTAVRPDAREVVVKDHDSGKPVTIAVGPDAVLRRLSPELAARLGSRRPGTGGPAEAAGAAPSPPTGPGSEPAGGDRMRRFPGAGGGGAADLLERLPTIEFGELKSGDVILVSSTQGADPSHANAIALVSGLEALAADNGPRGRAGVDMTPGLPAGLLELGIGLP